MAEQLTSTFYDANGANAIAGASICIGKLTAPGTSFYAKYVPSTGLFYLCDAAGAYVGGNAPGSSNLIPTNLGTLNCSQSTVTVVGNDLVIVWYITPSASLQGTQTDDLIASDIYGKSSGWRNLGSWTITAPTEAFSGPGRTLGFDGKKPSGGVT